MTASLPNIGFVGLGWPGERHAEGVIAWSLGTVHSACDLNQERLQNFVTAFRPARGFTDFKEMLADPALDEVVICLPNALHYPFSLQALQAGKHVLCEKPPTMNAAQMLTLHEEAKKLVKERRLGEIYFAESMWVRSRGTPDGVDGWFTERSKAGGGAIIDLGVHAIDAAWYL